jgi:hypothetical protein
MLKLASSMLVTARKPKLAIDISMVVPTLWMLKRALTVTALNLEATVMELARIMTLTVLELAM